MPRVLQRNALLGISACPKKAVTTSVELQTLTRQKVGSAMYGGRCGGGMVSPIWTGSLSFQAVGCGAVRTDDLSLPPSPRMPLRVSVHPTTKKERRRNYFGRIR